MDKTPLAGPGFSLSPHRLEALSDSVFSIAMTLLVLGFNIPAKAQMAAPGGPPDFFCHFRQELFFYILSFVILASFWMTHHRQFHLFKKVDEPLIWLNIALLALAALIPFSTNLIGDYPHDLFAALIFNCNLFLASLVCRLMMSHALARRGILDPDCDLAALRRKHGRTWLFPLVALAAVLISLVSPSWSTLVYLAMPFLHWFADIKLSV